MVDVLAVEWRGGCELEAGGEWRRGQCQISDLCNLQTPLRPNALGVLECVSAGPRSTKSRVT